MNLRKVLSFPPEKRVKMAKEYLRRTPPEYRSGLCRLSINRLAQNLYFAEQVEMEENKKKTAWQGG